MDETRPKRRTVRPGVKGPPPSDLDLMGGNQAELNAIRATLSRTHSPSRYQLQAVTEALRSDSWAGTALARVHQLLVQDEDKAVALAAAKLILDRAYGRVREMTDGQETGVERQYEITVRTVNANDVITMRGGDAE